MVDVQLTSHIKATESMPWGLHLIDDATSEPRQGGITVDIIAVHGLGANPDHAWVRHKDMSEGIKEDVRWLTDLLPQTLHNYKPNLSARIFCFNYQSAWLGPQLSRNRLEGLAGRLLDDIHNARDKNGAVHDRPLIFIGHSFGGLVIEQAVVQANSAGGRYEYLVKLIGGVVLLGTPHQGSKSQKWGSILANLANLVDYGETGLMEEVDEKSMKIFDMVSNFKKIMISMDLAKAAVICFYENRTTNYMSRVIKWTPRQVSSMVVEETSAVLSGFHSVVLDSDHLKLNKFPSADDGNYASVSLNLCKIASKAPELIRRRRKDQSKVIRIFSLVLANALSTKEPTSSQDSHFLVPRKRVKDFIGRENLLDNIRSHFSGDRTGSPPIMILYALGGQGKSQIALEYCRKWRDTYRGVFWIDANSATTVTQSYGTMAAEIIGETQIKTSSSAVKIKMVQGRLEQWNEAWLLVFDNYDDPAKFSEINQFIPTKGCGHILFTSRNRDLGRLGMLLEIPPMTTEEGVRLLLRSYNDSDIQARHQVAAASIVERLGRLALAIDQAAAYITYKRILLDRLEDFLTTYESERKKILSHTPKKFWEYEHINAFTTWELSFQQLVSGDEPWKQYAAHFLTLSAFFAPTTIAESLFRCYYAMDGSKVAWIHMFTETNAVRGDKGEENEEAGNEDDEDDRANNQSSGQGFYGTWDPDRFWDVIAKSDELSLLQSISQGTDEEGACFSLHPLIRDWLQLRLKKEDRAKYAQETILVLGCCVKGYEDRSTTWEEKTALITHMDVSLSNDEDFSEPQDRLGHNIANCNKASWVAYFYKELGRYHTSISLHRRVLETESSELSAKHPSTLHSMSAVGDLLYRLGESDEAERMHRRTLTLRKTELGEEHHNTLQSVNSLANVLIDQGRYEEAESLHRQVLALFETRHGKENPSVLTSMSNLSVTFYHQHRYEEAEQMCREILALQETVLGKEHRHTLISNMHLALILRDQNKYKEAEQMYRETSALQETVFGKEHPRTLTCICYLAELLKIQMRYEEAELIYREALALHEMVLGKEHSQTLSIREDLAHVLKKQGKYKEAELIAGVGANERSGTIIVASLAEGSASSNSVEVAGLSSVGGQEERQGAQLMWQDGEDYREGRHRGRRRARISRWAKRAVSSMGSLRLE